MAKTILAAFHFYAYRPAKLATCGGFSPFGALRHHLSPAVRGHNNTQRTNELISITKHSAAKTSPSGVAKELDL